MAWHQHWRCWFLTGRHYQLIALKSQNDIASWTCQGLCCHHKQMPWWVTHMGCWWWRAAGHGVRLVLLGCWLAFAQWLELCLLEGLWQVVNILFFALASRQVCDCSITPEPGCCSTCASCLCMFRWYTSTLWKTASLAGSWVQSVKDHISFIIF